MGMAAVLIVWPGTFEQTVVPLSHRSSKWNLNVIGPVVSEEKMFKECGRRRRTTTDNGGLPIYKLTKRAFGSGELISANKIAADWFIHLNLQNWLKGDDRE